MLDVWITLLTSQSRSSSSLGGKSGNTVISMLQQTMQRYLNEVKVSHLTVDKRDPEFGFYDQTKGVMTAYRYVYRLINNNITNNNFNAIVFFSVKPAVFDLFLTATIVAYLAVVYFGVQVNSNAKLS